MENNERKDILDTDVVEGTETIEVTEEVATPVEVDVTAEVVVTEQESTADKTTEKAEKKEKKRTRKGRRKLSFFANPLKWDRAKVKKCLYYGFPSLLIALSILFLVFSGLLTGIVDAIGVVIRAPQTIGAAVNGNVPREETPLAEGGGLENASFEVLMKNALESYETDVSLAHLGMSADEIKLAVQSYLFSHPEYFYVSTSSIFLMTTNSEVTGVRLSYLFEESEIGQKREELDAIVQGIVSEIPTGATELETVKYLYDHLVQHYNYQQSGTPVRDLYTFLVEKEGVCQGYMMAMVALCDAAGIECVPVLVNDGETSHAWNLVRVDGAWYHVDATWESYQRDENVYYLYFLLSDEAMREEDHDFAWEAPYLATSARFDTALFMFEN